MNKNNKIVAELLKSSGLKQIEFAERIGVSRSHLSMIIADTGNASDQLTELAQLKFAFKGEKESNTGAGNTVAPSDQSGRDAEMELLKDKLIFQMELCQKLQFELNERDSLISSLQEELLGKPNPSTRKAMWVRGC